MTRFFPTQPTLGINNGKAWGTPPELTRVAPAFPPPPKHSPRHVPAFAHEANAFAMGALPDGTVSYFLSASGFGSVTSRRHQAAAANALMERIRECLQIHLSTITTESVLELAFRRCNIEPQRLEQCHLSSLIAELEKGLKYYLDESQIQAVIAGLREIECTTGQSRIISFAVKGDNDISSSSKNAMEFVTRAMLGRPIAVKIAAAVSDIARFIVYIGSGTIDIRYLVGRTGIGIMANVTGEVTPNLKNIVEGRQQTTIQQILGLVAVRKLMTTFDLDVKGDEVIIQATMLNVGLR